MIKVQQQQNGRMRAPQSSSELLRAPHQVPFWFLAVKEDDEAREEVREKRRVTCVSLGAGSEAGGESRSRSRVRKGEEHAGQKRMETKN